VVREKIYHAVGAQTPQALTLDQIIGLIRGAGKVPAERDSFYNIIRTFEPGDGTRETDEEASALDPRPSALSV
jgi:aminodeoxyfutalosine synthase